MNRAVQIVFATFLSLLLLSACGDKKRFAKKGDGTTKVNTTNKTMKAEDCKKKKDGPYFLALDAKSCVKSCPTGSKKDQTTNKCLCEKGKVAAKDQKSCTDKKLETSQKSAPGVQAKDKLDLSNKSKNKENNVKGKVFEEEVDNSKKYAQQAEKNLKELKEMQKGQKLQVVASELSFPEMTTEVNAEIVKKMTGMTFLHKGLLSLSLKSGDKVVSSKNPTAFYSREIINEIVEVKDKVLESLELKVTCTKYEKDCVQLGLLVHDKESSALLFADLKSISKEDKKAKIYMDVEMKSQLKGLEEKKEGADQKS